MKSYKNLEIYKTAFDLAVETHRLSLTLPSCLGGVGGGGFLKQPPRKSIAFPTLLIKEGSIVEKIFC